MQTDELVPLTFRVPRSKRVRLKEILTRGDVTFQEWGAALVDLALGEAKGERDPVGGAAMLRTRAPRDAYRRLGRQMITGEPADGGTAD